MKERRKEKPLTGASEEDERQTLSRRDTHTDTHRWSFQTGSKTKTTPGRGLAEKTGEALEPFVHYLGVSSPRVGVRESVPWHRIPKPRQGRNSL